MKDRAVPEGIDDMTDHDMWFNEKVRKLCCVVKKDVKHIHAKSVNNDVSYNDVCIISICYQSI